MRSIDFLIHHARDGTVGRFVRNPLSQTQISAAQLSPKFRRG